MGTEERSQWNTRVPDELDEELDDFREKHGLNKSETTERLLRRGLKRGRRPRLASDARYVANTLGAGAIVTLVLGLFLPTVNVGAAAVGSVTFATVAAAAGLLSVHWESSHD